MSEENYTRKEKYFSISTTDYDLPQVHWFRFTYCNQCWSWTFLFSSTFRTRWETHARRMNLILIKNDHHFQSQTHSTLLNWPIIILCWSRLKHEQRNTSAFGYNTYIHNGDQAALDYGVVLRAEFSKKQEKT